jgi:hypothetical protein
MSGVRYWILQKRVVCVCSLAQGVWQCYCEGVSGGGVYACQRMDTQFARFS